MKSDVQHLVLTRFNLAINFECPKRGDSRVPLKQPWLEEDYLEKRFCIFEKYTFPSFLKQTDENFKWIVMFHKDTPERFKKRIKQLSDKMKQLDVWFLDDQECRNYVAIIKEYIGRNYAGKAMITTRVDNDDAVHPDFIATIKRSVEGQLESKIITYVNGLQYDSRDREIIKYDYVNNHFLSLYVSEKKMEHHILAFDHSKIDKVAKDLGIGILVEKTKIPLWVEIITETNYSNAPRWRFSAILVSYQIKAEYPNLELKWNTKGQWIGCTILNVGKVFIKRGMGLFEIIKESVKRRIG